MIKHVAFWVGFFAAALLIIPVAIGVWGAADEFARNLAVFIFGAVSALVILLVIALFLRDWVLRKVLGRAETTLDEVLSSLVRGVSAASDGDRQRAEQEAQTFVKAATGWYVWSGFYRWVVATAMGLLLAFGAFTGTVLLFEQNRKLGEQTLLMGQQSLLMEAQTERMAEQSTQFAMQNEIMTVSLVSELRSQLASTVERITLRDLAVADGMEDLDAPLFLSPDGQCGVGWNMEAPLSRLPSEAIIDAVVDLGVDRQISGQVIKALEFLLRDRDSAVAFGALQALDRLIEVVDVDVEDVTFSGLAVMEVRMIGSHSLTFEDSFVSFLTCNDCRAFLRESFAPILSVRQLFASDSMTIWDPERLRGGTNIVLLGEDEDAPEDATLLTPGPVGEDIVIGSAALTDTMESDVCSTLRFLARENALLRFMTTEDVRPASVSER